MRKKTLIVLQLFLTGGFITAQTNSKSNGKKQYLYLLRLESTMWDSSAGTPEKNQIVQNHFARLQKLLKEGIIILAGRTQLENDKTFGIVIYEANSFEEAKLIAENDPAVKAKIMNVEVYPYEVALMRGVN